ncbi:hypothetical protein [Litchfieldia alkalitelluris]|uniref:hypothetical protein n=1 Tax=Litchfieldia alkalitelluris TaxID=304268 RepID=UPI00099701F8|nr:hypothetical protein [Litchfieldia alkalitelluris]
MNHFGQMNMFNNFHSGHTKLSQEHYDCDCHKHHDHHHHENNFGHFCANCGKQHHVNKCEHPIIFDRRFVVDEHFFHPCGCLRDDHFDHRCLCDNRFRFRLAGLDGGFGFRLHQFKGCEIKVETDCEGTTKEVRGTVCSVGSDFLELQINKKQKGKKNRRKKKCPKKEFRIIRFNSIKSIKYREHDDCDCC